MTVSVPSSQRISFENDLSFSRLVYGMWRLVDDGDHGNAATQAKIEACLEQGITTIDQADIYGDYESEAAFGRMLASAPHLKDEIEVISKCDIRLISEKHPENRIKFYDTSANYITGQVENSLHLMGLETLDMLLLHRPDPLMDHHETGAVLDKLVSQGKIRAVGVSNFRPWDISLLQSAMQTPIQLNQIELSLLALDNFTNGDLAFCQEHHILPMAWSPLAGGQLFSDQNQALQQVLASMAEQQKCSVSAVAIAWLLAHPSQIMPVMGSNDLERIKDFSAALSVEMDRQSWFELYTASLGHEVA